MSAMQSYITVIMRNILYRVGSDSFREKHKERDRGAVEVNNIFQIALTWTGLLLTVHERLAAGCDMLEIQVR